MYARVSTDEQGTSIINQQNFFQTYIERNGWILYKIYSDEAFSGTESTKRKAFQSLIKDAIAKKYDVLLAKSYSRFGRNQRETLDAIAEIRKQGIRIIFIEDNLDSLRDMTHFGLFAWLAEQEAQKVSERIKTVWNHYDQIGVIHSCNPPYGYTYSKELKNYNIIKSEADVVKEIYKMYINGLGMSSIAKNLIERGIPSKKDGEWASNTIRKILCNEVYIGRLVQGKSKSIDVTIKKREEIESEKWVIHEKHHEPIIDENTFYTAQECLKERAERHKYNRHSNQTLFSNLIYCSHCKCAFTIKHRKNCKNYNPFYTCINYDLKGVKYAGHKRVAIYEDLIKGIIKQDFLLQKKNNFEQIKKIITAHHNKDFKPSYIKSQLAQINLDIEKNVKLSLELLKLYSDGLLGDMQLKTQNEIIEANLKELQAKKDELKSILKKVTNINSEEEIISSIDKLLDDDVWTNEKLRKCISKIWIDPSYNITVEFKYSKVT